MSLDIPAGLAIRSETSGKRIFLIGGILIDFNDFLSKSC